ncbi:DEAD/DEAH box helicase [Halomicrobium katesii]|uniref:DEAD/DEAH box helicase n=1 Tax=Halomicrobium katesii TaxID=437163 RepID=UPI00036AFF38|nr:DEAD/DEAH box helicase [Halomicrobium katesii]
MSGLDDLQPEDASLVESIMDSHGFDSLKKTQELAFEDGILETGNHLLVAETGNGKTLCAEAVAKKRLEQGNRVAYLVPSRQLVRAKKESIQEWAEDEYTVWSGAQAYQSADVVVATFDSFYRAILQNRGNARNLDLAILDDFHEIYGGFRGPEIEKAIAASMYEGIELFALSATLGNPDELAEWMDADLTVSPEGRQIPIREHVEPVQRQNKGEAIVDLLRREQDKGPFLVFNYAKPWTQSRAESVAQTRLFTGLSDRDFHAELRDKIDGEMTDTLRDLARMMSRGVAFHHADLPNDVKHWVEDLYEDGELGCLFATTTIAYGFDAPVQSVVVADITRGPHYVGVYEYVQWIGRAARPGYGYDEGFAFTLTDAPEETKERFFEPHRVLEDVTTHIEIDIAFQWLLLELIATGWDTPHEIEAFIKEMLYWQQMEQIGAWGRQRTNRDQRLNDRLRETADWLEEHEFIIEKDTARQFEPTALGDGSVEFAFNSFVSAPLSSLRTFYDWLEEASHDEITPLYLIDRVARQFDRTVNASESAVKSELSGLLQEHDLPVDEAGITAGVVYWFWMSNFDNTQIENRTGIDPTYLPSTARKLSDVIDATKYLMDASPNARKPDWFDTLVFRVERGVRSEEVPFVENIRGLGRYRVRRLRRYVEGSDVVGMGELEGETLWELLQELYDGIGDSTQFEDVLKGNVTGIGPATAKRVREFLENVEISDEFGQKDDWGTVRPSSERPEESDGFSHATRLDDF